MRPKRPKRLLLAVVAAAACAGLGCGRSGLTAVGSNDSAPLTLTVLAERVEEDLSEFPVFVDVAHPALIGADSFQILDSSGAPVPFEIVHHDMDGGSLQMWVRMNLSATQDTQVTLFHALDDSPDIGLSSETWSNGFVASWHFEEADGPRSDSTLNEIAAMDSTSQPGATGRIGDAAWFASDTDYLQVIDDDSRFDEGGLDAGTSDFTVSTWIYLTEHTGAWDTIFEKGIFSHNNGYGFYVDRTGVQQTLSVYLEDRGTLERMYAPSANVELNTWHHVAAVVDRSALLVSFYMDGVSLGSTSTGQVDPGDPLDTDSDVAIGQHTGVDPCCALRGAVDELRLSNTIRSQGWIHAEFLNQSTNDFVLVGVTAD